MCIKNGYICNHEKQLVIARNNENGEKQNKYTAKSRKNLQLVKNLHT